MEFFMVLDFKVNARLVVGMTINFFCTFPDLTTPARRTRTPTATDTGFRPPKKRFPAIADRKSFGASANVMRR